MDDEDIITSSFLILDSFLSILLLLSLSSLSLLLSTSSSSSTQFNHVGDFTSSMSMILPDAAF